MHIGIFIFLFISNFFLYFAGCALVFLRRKYTSVSIRSPIMILANNVSGFFIGAIIIVQFILQNLESCSEGWYYAFGTVYLFQFIMMFTFILRCQRVVHCCQINTDERIDSRQFNQKKRFYTESFYVKILIGFSLIIAVLIIIFDTLYMLNLNITNCLPVIGNPDSLSNKGKSLLWIITNFISQFALITYAYLMSIYDAKQKMHLEASLYTIFWLIFSNLISIYDLFYYNDSNPEPRTQIVFGTLALIGLYGCFAINTFFPVVLSYIDQISIEFHFNPKLMSNLFLFLSNEHCYSAFSSYLSKSQTDTYYLQIYTQIMKFKLQIANEDCCYHALKSEANAIYSQHFIKPNKLLTEATVMKVEEAFKDLGNPQEGIKNDIFDDALLESFKHLSKRYSQFKRRDEFASLSEMLNLNSYVQCKMVNAGLIKKY